MEDIQWCSFDTSALTSQEAFSTSTQALSSNLPTENTTATIPKPGSTASVNAATDTTPKPGGATGAQVSGTSTSGAEGEVKAVKPGGSEEGSTLSAVVAGVKVLAEYTSVLIEIENPVAAVAKGVSLFASVADTFAAVGNATGPKNEVLSNVETVGNSIGVLGGSAELVIEIACGGTLGPAGMLTAAAVGLGLFDLASNKSGSSDASRNFDPGTGFSRRSGSGY